MITFRCKNCNKKVSVDDQHCGKRVKCPQCDEICVIPNAVEKIEFSCVHCDCKICVSKTLAGKKGRCPKCKGQVSVPSLAVEEPKPVLSDLSDSVIQLQALAIGVDVVEDVPGSEEDSSDSQVSQPEQKRKLPWFIDILLYPFNIPGLTFFVIVIGVPLIVTFISFFFNWLAQSSPLFIIIDIFFVFVGLFIKVVIFLYMFWYFCQCIRSSADGDLRAPETLGSSPSIGELFGQIFRIVVCHLILWCPVLYYLVKPLKHLMPGLLFTWPFYVVGAIFSASVDSQETYAFFVRNEIHFFSLVGVSIFFFPMGLLAVVMFDSLCGLNPILIIGSIASTFFRYCGIVLIFYIPIPIFVLISHMLFKFMPMILGLVILKTLYIYLLMASACLLGKFYWWSQGKLNWGV